MEGGVQCWRYSSLKQNPSVWTWRNAATNRIQICRLQSDLHERKTPINLQRSRFPQPRRWWTFSLQNSSSSSENAGSAAVHAIVRRSHQRRTVESSPNKIWKPKVGSGRRSSSSSSWGRCYQKRIRWRWWRQQVDQAHPVIKSDL